MFEFNKIYDFKRHSNLLSPVFITSPHSGRIYPNEYIKITNFKKANLRTFEDCYIDKLYDFSQSLGVRSLINLVPRIIIDLNRNNNEIDEDMFINFSLNETVKTSRVLSGIGLFPRLMGSEKIYKEKPNWDFYQTLLENIYNIWHSKLIKELHDLKSVFKEIVLLDCHSMPTIRQDGRRVKENLSDFVIGDLWEGTCNEDISTFVIDFLKKKGFTVAKNNPYAGGYIIENYGKPQQGMNALQVEIRRDLYLDEKKLELNNSYYYIKRVLRNLVSELSERLIEKNQYKQSAE